MQSQEQEGRGSIDALRAPLPARPVSRSPTATPSARTGAARNPIQLVESWIRVYPACKTVPLRLNNRDGCTARTDHGCVRVCTNEQDLAAPRKALRPGRPPRSWSMVTTAWPAGTRIGWDWTKPRRLCRRHPGRHQTRSVRPVLPDAGEHHRGQRQFARGSGCQQG